VEPKHAPGCATEDCSVSKEWTLDSDDYAPGSHTVEVKATDKVGLVASKQLTVSTTKDTTAPQINAPSTFFAAPDGWVEQRSYLYSVSATDFGGYGATSLTFKIDGKVVNSATGTCAIGGCQRSFGGTINIATYKGGAHPAELIATDAAGLMTKKQWTINVDPKGTVGLDEAEDTLEAVEETSGANLIGPSEPEEEIEGSGEGLGFVEAGGELKSVGSMTPAIVALDPNEGMTVETVDAIAVESSCVDQGPESEKAVQSHEPCEGESAEVSETEDFLQPIEITPKVTGEGSLTSPSAGGAAAVAPNTANHVDTITRPTYEGLLTFSTIRDAQAPEAYTWNLGLGEGMTVKSIDAENAQVYYDDGHEAFGISAIEAHDAVGTKVPTELIVNESEQTISLKVTHRSSAFVYPVVSGAGWQGGYFSVEIEGPMDEQEIREEEERIRKEEQEQLEREWEENENGGEGQEGSVREFGMTLIVRASAIGPPVASDSKATASQKSGTPAHIFKFSECEYWLGDLPKVPVPKRRINVASLIGSCLRAGSTDKIKYGMTVRGWFHYITGEWVWVNEHPADQLECVKWGDPAKKPAMVHCFANPWKAREGITVRGDYRTPPEFFSLCHTVYGELHSTPPYKVLRESIVTNAFAGPEWEPCNWPQPVY
jgi:hypothetical protein